MCATYTALFCLFSFSNMGERIDAAVKMTGLALFILFNLLFTLCRNIVWLANGTYDRIRRHRQNYATSAHKLHIVCRHYLDLLMPVELNNFLLTHDDFVHPEYVLKDSVTLLQLTKDTAIFIEADPTRISPSSPYFGFFVGGQMETGVKIVTMPLTSFKRLCEALPENPAKLLFIHNTTRCGSTLVSSVLSHTGRAYSLSEPRALDTVCNLYGKAWTDSESKCLVGHVIRMVTKPLRDTLDAPLVYAVKPLAANIPFADIFRELFPSSASIFVYRDMKATTLSSRLLASRVPSIALLHMLIQYGTKSIRAEALSQIGISSKVVKGFDPKYEPTMEFIYIGCMNIFQQYLNLRDKGMDIRGFRYEDLRDSPGSMIPKLLDLVGIPRVYVNKAMEAMGKDSQEFTAISRKEMGKCRAAYVAKFEPSSEFLDYIQAQYDANGVPGPRQLEDKNFRLPGTITP